MKGGAYTKTLAKIQVRGIFRIRDIRRNVLPKLIEICMETPCWCSPTLHEKMDLQQLQNQCKYEVNTTFDQICLYLPRGKFHRWIIFAREAKMVNTAFTQSLQSKVNEKKNCTFASDLKGQCPDYAHA